MQDMMISTRDLSKRYGRTLAVDRVDLDLAPGKVYALAGRNGAGKSSLIKMLLGLEPVTDGKATVLGLDSRSDHVEIRQRVGYVPETHHIYGWMTVEEVCRFTAGFYPSWDLDLCRQLLDDFGLDRAKKVSGLSRGMTAKAALVLALAHRPELLILDEPTSGLDAVVRKQFLESIVSVAADEGRTVLISSHLLAEVERICDTVLLLDRGKLLFAEDAESLRERVREITVTFDGDPPDATGLPETAVLTKAPHEWRMIVPHFTPETPGSIQEWAGPSAAIATRAPGLEEIFIALTGNSPEE
ncbi:MAG: ABC transporter ATP-binding protein [Lentisphaerae bacterium]|jgi:ABC-2 type transport system ATP-binding protein|nr:ABC transporter ATP-binding protein [Lentisphaerota bacterium]MBT4819457.1 ABC transporter ATP-binding protein [Lentisphaerota bacterium]MBT5612060.1 ABC transporter ATP-binding protein [Lentisphaerota bacterium]MBT7056898.1 ABC transporter ATP-binding protein [Lentisphaerota bacterium]MBT7842051.1 ABC transporter ATP-binding protein [Lentisphaerota bacterium]